MRAHALDFELKGARLIEGAARHRVARAFLDRQTLAGKKGLVERRAAALDGPVERHFVSRPNREEVADQDVTHGHVPFFAVDPVHPVHNEARRFRLELEELFDRGRGSSLRARLQKLSEEHEGNDHGGRVEVEDRLDTARLQESRKDGRGYTVEIGRPGTDRYQAIHVERETSKAPLRSPR